MRPGRYYWQDRFPVGDATLKVSVIFDYIPAEKPTQTHPGCPAEVAIVSVKAQHPVNGKIIDVDPDKIAHGELVEAILEHTENEE